MAAAPPSPETFSAAASSIAAAQICQAIGFRRAEPSALRTLSDLLGRYLRSLAAIAASHALSHGRTGSNLLDVLHALEVLHGPRGFPGAADPHRSLLSSDVLRGVATFVSLVDEIPFAVPMRRHHHNDDSTWRRRTANSTFREIASQPPGPHIPNWLPVYPERKLAASDRRRETLWPGECGGGLLGGGWERDKNERLVGGDVLLKERKRVRFRIGDVMVRGGVEVHVMGGAEENCFGVVRKLRRCDGRVCAPMALGVNSQRCFAAESA